MSKTHRTSSRTEISESRTDVPSTTCPTCGGPVERRAGVEVCQHCGWVPRRGAD